MTQQLQRIALNLENVSDTALIAVAKTVKDIAQREAKRTVGGDMRLSNVGRRGAKLSVRDDYEPGKGRSSVVISGKPPAVWSWITNGTAGHLIGVTRRGNVRRSRPFLAFGPNEVRRAPVRHKGSRKLRTWTRVREQSERIVPLVFSEELGRILNR